jgi:hypothetical protein
MYINVKYLKMRWGTFLPVFRTPLGHFSSCSPNFTWALCFLFFKLLWDTLLLILQTALGHFASYSPNNIVILFLLFSTVFSEQIQHLIQQVKWEPARKLPGV